MYKFNNNIIAESVPQMVLMGWYICQL